MQAIAAGPEDEGLRLDQFLVKRLPELSRARVQQLIRDGHVVLDRGTAKPGLVIHADLTAHVDIPPPAPAIPAPEALPLTSLYDDGDLVVIDKPAGMVVHPAAGHPTGTLVNALLHHVGGLSGIGGMLRPGIVHRLDKGTSGVMVIAKNDASHQHLAKQFHDRLVKKEYVALVWGLVAAGGTLDSPIGRDKHHRTKMSSRATHARSALTTISAAEAFRGVTLISVLIGTGRTHQIRVHLSESGHPIVGDSVYGGLRKILPTHLSSLAGLDRPFLHAAVISFTHPRSGAPITINAPMPEDLSSRIAALRQSALRS